MPAFAHAHAAHPQWVMAAALVVTQLRAQLTAPPINRADEDDIALGFVYFTDAYASDANDLLSYLRTELPFVQRWVGSVGIGVLATGVEYMDEPAMAIMLCDIPTEQVQVFSGVSPLAPSGDAALGWPVQSAWVHCDGAVPDLSALVEELAQRTVHNVVFGGISSSRNEAVQIAYEDSRHLGLDRPKGGVLLGGLSGLAFGPEARVRSRVTQGCRPVGPARSVTAMDGRVVLQLNDRPAMDALFEDLNVSWADRPHAIARLQQTLVGLESAAWVGDTELVEAERLQTVMAKRAGLFGAQTRVRHLVGLDVDRKGVVVGDHVWVGDDLQFCERHVQAARADLMRVCAELREEVEGQEDATGAIRGAVYVSCLGRGGAHFGAPNAEMKIIQHALGDVPVVGFFAGGEIAHQHILSYSGVLMVFA